MEDIKAMMNVGKSEFGIPGYTVAKTHHYITKSAVISPDRPSKSSKSKENLPDPTKYSPTLQKLQDTYWKTPNGKFKTSKKINFIEEQVKRSKSNPGPGTYMKDTDKQKANKIPLGQFDKCERLSFLTTVESYAEETPCSWKYNSPTYKISSSVRWITPKAKEKKEKDEIGPGKYSEGVDKYLGKMLSQTPKYSIPKAKTPKGTGKATPGVGSYKDSETGFFKHVAKRNRATVILPYKIKGFTETIIKNAAKTPGPGAYNITQQLKK